MGVFSRVYDWTLNASRHRHAPWVLGGVSFAESSFFPVPPDVMLAPMTLAQPQAWLRLATITTLASVLGAIFGYAIGFFLIDQVLPLIDRWGYLAAYQTAADWFVRYGFWTIVVAGTVTPVPFKLFTICAGAAQMALLPFVLGALVGRASRFFLVAGLMRVLGPPFEAQLRRFVDTLGWSLLALLAVGASVWLWLR